MTHLHNKHQFTIILCTRFMQLKVEVVTPYVDIRTHTQNEEIHPLSNQTERAEACTSLRATCKEKVR